MKIRFYPKTQVVKDYIQAKLDDANAKVFSLEAKLEAASQPRQLYQDPGPLRVALALETRTADECVTQLMFLEAHEPSEVMAEIETE